MFYKRPSADLDAIFIMMKHFSKSLPFDDLTASEYPRDFPLPLYETNDVKEKKKNLDDPQTQERSPESERKRSRFSSSGRFDDSCLSLFDVILFIEYIASLL